jgi:hypothetical protein
MHITELVLISAVALVVLGGFTAYLASEKGYPAAVWFWLGFLFPVVGFLAAIGLPKKSQ